MKYDLEDRTLNFSEQIIGLCRDLRAEVILKPILEQLLRSATSIGANYREANGASSKADFRNKIYLCRKEAGESRYWLQLLARAKVKEYRRILELEAESLELSKIFQAILNTINRGAT